MFDLRPRSPGGGAGWYLVGVDSSTNDAPQAGQARPSSGTEREQAGQVVIVTLSIVPIGVGRSTDCRPLRSITTSIWNFHSREGRQLRDEFCFELADAGDKLE